MNRATGALAAAILAIAAIVGTGAPGSAAAPDTKAGSNGDVRVLVTRLDPTVLDARSTVTVAGRLTNTTGSTLTDTRVRLQADTALTSRAALAEADRDPPESNAATCAWTTLPALQPHQTVGFSTRCPATGVRGLKLARTGVYPLLVNVNADLSDGRPARVGEARSYLPFFSRRPTAPTELSWLWPIVDAPHRLINGYYVDDELPDRLARTGRVGRLVDAALRAPSSVQLAVAIDPELVNEAAGLVGGYMLVRDGKAVRRPASPAAEQFLRDLRKLVHRPNVRVIALPYADPDLVAMQHAGLWGRYSGERAMGQDLLRSRIGAPAGPDVVWPPGGTLDDSTLDALVGQGVGGIVLSSGSLPATGARTPTAQAVAQLPALGGSTRALTTDDAVDALVGTTRFDDGARLAEQRFLAEVAMITVEDPGTGRTLLVAPPRRWTVPTGYADALLRDSSATAVPWLSPAPLSSLLATPTVAQRGPLRFGVAAARTVIPRAGMNPVITASARLDGIRGAVSNTAASKLLAPYDGFLLVCSSSAWQLRPSRAGPFLRDLTTRVEQLSDRVTVIRPTQGTYSLASSGSPLVLTVQSTLPVPIRVRLTATARGGAGFRAEPELRTIAAKSRLTIRLPAKVERSGSFTVTAQVQTPSGQLLGQPATLKIHSRAYGSITLGITGGALALLFLLVARRLYRRLRRPPVPPARSPVERPVEPVAP